MPRPRSRALLKFCACLAGAACTNGGGNAVPASPTWTEVSFTASNHLLFFSTGGWTGVPISPTRVWASSSRLEMFGNGTYRFTDADGQNGASTRRYFLTDAGSFGLELDTTSTLPTDAYGLSGIYSRAGASALREPGSTPDLFLSHSSWTSGLASLNGIEFGTRVVPGPVELGGDWHLLSLHVILEQTAPSPDSVGRGARGNVGIASGAPGTPRAISGTGSQGTNSVTYGGTVQNLLQNGGDGRCNLTVRYEVAGQPADDRVMLAVARPDTVLGLDADASDGEAGQLFLVRKFDVATAPVDPARVPGRFPCAARGVVVNPASGRSLHFRGVFTLDASGDFTLEVASLGSISGYTAAGSWTLAADGAITLSVLSGLPGGPQTWFAAIDRGYNSLVFLDDFVETGTAPALSLGFGIREKAPN